MANDKQTQICPHCGKPGKIEEVEGQTYYVHKQPVEFGKETTNFGFKLPRASQNKAVENREKQNRCHSCSCATVW